MRLFVGIPISDEIKEKIYETLEPKKKKFPNLNFSPYENMHITVKFLGEINPLRLSNIEKRVEKAVGNTKSFKALAEGAGLFPDLKNPRVLWLGAKGKGLIDLTRSFRAEFDNIKKEDYKKIVPHITFARTKYLLNPDKLAELISELSNLDFGKMQVDNVVLYESVISENGTIYRRVRSFPLK
ncbi:MAG: RNA 2',3'-cyclic phosphodiesterase [Candidatus ainarchaeum sp.]|nr:RNA 2',3'-cyclic phosphodiesterase [Candidatus ainarchaeum sp.]